LGKPIKQMRKGCIQAAVFKNMSTTGKPYLTIQLDKAWFSKKNNAWVKDTIKMDRKGLAGMIWVLEGLQDWINGHM
jgi:hypothetical protein